MLLAMMLAASAVSAADPHSYGNSAEVRPTHLALDLQLDFEQKTIRGRTELTLEYRAKGVDHLSLDTRDLTVGKVTDPATGKALAFKLGERDRVLGQELRIELPQPPPAKVRVEYETSPEASALQWLEPRQTASGRKPYLFTQSQAIHARSWIPCMDTPGVRTTYEAVVTAPAGLNVVMSAEHGQHDTAKGVYRFKMPQRIPSYLIALAAGEFAFKALGPRTGVYAELPVLEKAAWELADMEKMVIATEKLYGEYAWGRWDAIVLPPSFPYGGMENPRVTFATPTIIAGDRSLTSLMAHELAHSWSGNLVTNANWNDFWLNEGFTRYIEARIVEALEGPEVAEMEFALGQQRLRELVKTLAAEGRLADARLRLHLEGRDPDEATGNIQYEKGANFLRLLEKHFGRGRFDAFLRGYFKANAFGNTTTDLFLATLKKDLFRGDEAAWTALKVDEWIDGEGMPPTLVEAVTPRFDRTRAAAKEFAASGKTEGLGKGWTTWEWLDFLDHLPEPVSAEQLAALDGAFKLTTAGNLEIRFAFLKLAADIGWEPAFPAIEAFLTQQGRMKFISPIYRALGRREATRPAALRIFEKARPGYHPLAVAAVGRALAPPKN